MENTDEIIVDFVPIVTDLLLTGPERVSPGLMYPFTDHIYYLRLYIGRQVDWPPEPIRFGNVMNVPIELGRSFPG